MRKILFSAVVVVIACLCGGAAFAFSADDFIPPVQAKDKAQEAELLTVKDKDAVKTVQDENLDMKVTEAATLQDAANSIVEKMKRGCQIVRLSPEDGLTFIATGIGTFNPNHKNVVMSRIEQRNAYVTAFMDAKAQMAQTVGEIVVRGATNFDKKLETLHTPQKSLKNIESELSESQMQSVRKVLKGYVTYAVKDDGEGSIYVSIASSPKTRGKYNRRGTDGIVAGNVTEGLNTLFAEIKNNLVPPVGGRIIEIPDTGEVVWVGFGNAVIDKDDEPDVQAELNLVAEQIAGIRARDALAGIILGDDTRWEGHADEGTKKQKKDFDKAQQSDHTTKESEAEMRALQARRSELRSGLSTGTAIQSLRNGVLPPGTMVETELDENEYFAYGIALYMPSLTNQVRDASREMDEAQIVVQPPKQDSAADEKDSSSSFEGQQNSHKQELDIKKGPTGVIKQNL